MQHSVPITVLLDFATPGINQFSDWLVHISDVLQRTGQSSHLVILGQHLKAKEVIISGFFQVGHC
jgi:hypothetical protein